MKGQISSVKSSLLPQFCKYALLPATKGSRTFAKSCCSMTQSEREKIDTRNFNLNFSRCRNRIFDFDIAALDLVFFEWSYSFPHARIRFPLYLPLI